MRRYGWREWTNPVWLVAFALALTDSTAMFICTRIAHAIQRFSGRTNYTIAQVGLGIEMASLAVDFLKPGWPELFPGNATTFLPLSAGFILWDILQWAGCKINEGRLYECKALHDMERPWIWRLYNAALVIVSAVKWWYVPHPYFLLSILDVWGASIGAAIFVYFVSVVPLPPQQSKLEEWSEARQLARAMQSGAGA